MWEYLGQAEAPTEPFPAVPAPRPSGVAEKAREQPDAAAQPGPAAVPVAEPPAVPAQRPPADAQRPPADAQRPPADAQRPPAEQHPGRTDSRDEKTASPEQVTASRDEVPSHQKNGLASLGKPQLHGTKGLARRPGESPPWAPVPPPTTAPPKFAPPKSVLPQPAPAPSSAPSLPPETPALPPGRPGRSHRLIGAVMLLLLARPFSCSTGMGTRGRLLPPRLPHRPEPALRLGPAPRRRSAPSPRPGSPARSAGLARSRAIGRCARRYGLMAFPLLTCRCSNPAGVIRCIRASSW